MKKQVALLVFLVVSLTIFGPSLSASATQSNDEFEVLSLTLNNGVATDSENVTGDDNGFVAINGNDLLNTGDSGVGAFSSLTTLTAPPTVVNSLTPEDGTFLFTDLKTQTSKMFVRVFSADWVYELTGIDTLNSAGQIIGSTVPLSEVISLDMRPSGGQQDCFLIGSGYDRIALWNICSGVVWDIKISTGDVRTLTNQATKSSYTTLGPFVTNFDTESVRSSSFAASGIVEYAGGELRFVLVGVESYSVPRTLGIYRYLPSAPSTAPESVLMFSTNGMDLYNFTASTVTNQWCGHTEGGFLLPAMANMFEPVFCADAAFRITPAPSPEPILPVTGFDLAPMGISGFVSLGLVAMGVVLWGRYRGVSK